MLTYVYETIPAKSGAKPRSFEIKQSMNDAPLQKHPETGEPVRRLVLGGSGVLRSKASGGHSGSCCGSRCACH